MGSKAADEEVMVHLLDPATGHPVQVWILASQPEITIGRDPEQDVPIADPYVSRQHAKLCFQEGEWRLVSLGRNGVLIDGRRVTELSATNGLRFRLGADGPTLRFYDSPPAESNPMTLAPDCDEKLVLRVDESKLNQEVREIADGEYFHRLQQQARELRRQREGG